MSILHSIQKIKFKRPPRNEVVKIFREAFEFGHSVLDSSGYVCSSTVTEGIPKSTRAEIRAIGGWHEGGRCLAWSGFFHGLMQRVPNGAPRGCWQCAGQQKLSLAVFHLPTDVAAGLARIPDGVPIDRDEWMRSYAGAVGFARVASALQQAGTLYLPSPIEDVREKIDLVLELESVALCLTIKTDAAARASTWHVVDEAHLRPDMETYLYRFSRGVRDFERRHGGPCVPIHMIVSTYFEGISRDIDDCPSITDACAAMAARYADV